MYAITLYGSCALICILFTGIVYALENYLP